MKSSKKLSSGVVQLQHICDYKLDQARALRRKMTPAEKILWEVLRGKRCAGLKFRRQQIIEGFIADFFCPAKNLVIEVDGPIHEREEQKKKDEHRCAVFKTRGLQELRFTNNDILKDIIVVQSKILSFCKNETGQFGYKKV